MFSAHTAAVPFGNFTRILLFSSGGAERPRLNHGTDGIYQCCDAWILYDQAVRKFAAATAADVRQLLKNVEEIVYEKSGIRLTPEIRIW